MYETVIYSKNNKNRHGMKRWDYAREHEYDSNLYCCESYTKFDQQD